jgi:hypothetical protein
LQWFLNQRRVATPPALLPTKWDRYTEFLETISPAVSFPTVYPPPLLYGTVALPESVLSMARITAATSHGVTYRPNHLPEELKAITCLRCRLIRVVILSQSA